MTGLLLADFYLKFSSERPEDALHVENDGKKLYWDDHKIYVISIFLCKRD